MVSINILVLLNRLTPHFRFSDTFHQYIYTVMGVLFRVHPSLPKLMYLNNSIEVETGLPWTTHVLQHGQYQEIVYTRNTVSVRSTWTPDPHGTTVGHLQC